MRGVEAETLYDVGGVRLRRPFKIRRLGHFGYNCLDLDGMLRFYVDGLGFIVSDQSGKMPSRLPDADQAGLTPPRSCCTSPDSAATITSWCSSARRCGTGSARATVRPGRRSTRSPGSRQPG